jgi:hypothetical protein
VVLVPTTQGLLRLRLLYGELLDGARLYRAATLGYVIKYVTKPSFEKEVSFATRIPQYGTYCSGRFLKFEN